jgi:pseudouridine kinase
MTDVIVFGGANIDVKAKTLGAHIAATSNPGVVSTSFGGVGRNIASNLARLGADVLFVTAVGNDAQGQALLKATRDSGVDVSGCLGVNGNTGTYCAVLDQHGELVTAVSDMAVLEALTPDVVEKNAPNISSARYVVADCNLRSDTLAALAAVAGTKLIVEPVSVAKSNRLWELLQTTSVFAATPNMAQARHRFDTSFATACVDSLQKAGLQNVVLLAGADGAYVGDGMSTTHVPSQADRIIDVTGAGDAAVAGFVFGLLQNMPLVEAVRLGQKTAARVMASAASALE